MHTLEYRRELFRRVRAGEIPAKEAEALLGIRHVDDIPWYRAPLPRRWHRCRVQTSSFAVDRCPCGAIRPAGAHWWIERNSRRRG